MSVSACRARAFFARLAPIADLLDLGTLYHLDYQQTEGGQDFFKCEGRRGRETGPQADGPHARLRGRAGRRRVSGGGCGYGMLVGPDATFQVAIVKG
jgi:hypothetical protein